MMPKIKVSPEATSARIMPVTTPLIVWIRIWSNGISMLASLSRHSRERGNPERPASSGCPWTPALRGGDGECAGPLHPQILMDHRVVDLERGGWCVMPDDTFFQNVNPLRRIERQRHVLLDEQHSDMLAMQYIDDFPDL